MLCANNCLRRNYLPILFDFDKPASKDVTGTVSTLTHLSRFKASMQTRSVLSWEAVRRASSRPLQRIS
jgi:hypothetical protein